MFYFNHVAERRAAHEAQLNLHLAGHVHPALSGGAPFACFVSHIGFIRAPRGENPLSRETATEQ